MILVDFSQICIGIIFQGIDNKGNVRESYLEEGEDTLSPSLLRHIFLSNILYYKKEFSEFGELLFCIDDRYPWRKQLFKYYKYKRGKHKEKSGVDWDMVYEVMDKFKCEIRDDLRFRVLEVPGAEADDIIAVIIKNFSGPLEEILIISSDKDFKQLHHYENIQQYSPAARCFIEEKNPKRFLKEHIILGDPGDGIPNILSPINCFKKGIRQTSLRRKEKLAPWMATKISEIDWDETTRKRFKQNRILIDFNNIPEKVTKKILAAYDEMLAEEKKPRSYKDSMKFSDYFAKNGLKELFSRISEF